MAANKRKILESARKLAQKGAKEKALKEYQKLLKLDPKDAKLRLEIGDAHRRWGQVNEAVDTYRRVAEQYMAEGFDARAVAVFKQILNLDPDRLDAYAPLAELYERMGLASEALGALQTAADGYHRQGKKSEALEILRKMAHADPTNTTSRIKVADLLRNEGQTEDALAEYQLAAEELERQNEVEGVGNVYRRMLEIDGSNVGALSALASNLAKRGKAAEAVPLAERALELDAATPGHYELVTSLYERTERAADAVAVYRRLADLHRERGDEDAARGILQRHVPAEMTFEDGQADVGAPDELSSEGLLDGGDDPLFDEEFPGAEEGPDIAVDFGNDIDIGGTPITGADATGTLEPGDSLDASLFTSEEDEADAVTHAAVPPVRPTAPADGPAEIDVDQLLAEASVYLRYGKRDKAVAHLESVLAGDAGHRGALEKLGEVCAEDGESERAVEMWMRAAQRAIADGDDEGVRVLRGRIAALDEDAALSLGNASVTAPDLAASDAEPPPEASAGDELELDLDVGADELDFDDELLDDAALGDVVADPVSSATETEPDEVVLEDVADDLEIDVETEHADDGAPEAVDALDAPEIPDLLEDVDEPVAAAPEPALDAVPASASQSASGLSAETSAKVMEDLEEADFYVQQGLNDEAEEIYRRVLSIAPNHPRAMLRLGELAAARGEEPAAVVPGVAEDAGEGAVTDEFEFDDESADASSFSNRVEEPVSIDTAADEIEDPEPALASDDLANLTDLDLPESDAGDDAPAGASAIEDETEAEPSGDGSDTEEFVPNLESAAPGEGFDLAAALADAFDDDPADSALAPEEDEGFEAVFDAFKKGVKETLGAGDHQAHYDLAIAYKEMGLHDDAIAELRFAMADPGRTAECLHLIGLCAIGADQPPLAIEHLEQLLGMSGQSDEAQLAVHFDLGRAFAAMGDADGARREWEQVAAGNPDFQDVRERLAALDDPPADDDDAPGAEPEPDAGENFDDLVAEANDDDELRPDLSGEARRRKPAPKPQEKPRPGRKKKISFV